MTQCNVCADEKDSVEMVTMPCCQYSMCVSCGKRILKYKKVKCPQCREEHHERVLVQGKRRRVAAIKEGSGGRVSEDSEDLQAALLASMQDSNDFEGGSLDVDEGPNALEAFEAIEAAEEEYLQMSLAASTQSFKEERERFGGLELEYVKSLDAAVQESRRRDKARILGMMNADRESTLKRAASSKRAAPLKKEEASPLKKARKTSEDFTCFKLIRCRFPTSHTSQPVSLSNGDVRLDVPLSVSFEAARDLCLDPRRPKRMRV